MNGEAARKLLLPAAIFAVFAQLTATAYVEAIWIDVSRAFYFERMVGVAFWALLLGLLMAFIAYGRLVLKPL